MVLAVASCSEKSTTTYAGGSGGANPDDNGTKPVSTEGMPVHPKLAIAAKYLDTDGVYLTLNQVSMDIDFFMGILRETEEATYNAKPELKGLTPTLSESISKTKLDQIVSMGSSVKKVEGGWLNKEFYDLNGTQDGVFSIFKGMGGAWAAYEYAPAGTDFVQEMDFNVENIRETLSLMLKGTDPKMKGKVDEAIEEALRQTPQLSVLLDGMHVRWSMALKLDDTQKIAPGEGIEFPNVDMVYRIEGLVPVFMKFESELPPLFKMEEKAGLKYYTLKDELPPQPGVPAISPVFVVDEAKNQIWASLRTGFLEECMGAGPKLKDEPEFKNLMKDLSESGNMFYYVSHDVLVRVKEIYDGNMGDMVKSQARKEVSKEAGGQDEALHALSFIEKIVEQKIFPTLLKSKGGYAYTVDLNQDGLLASSRTPIPLKGSYGNSSLMAVPAIASLAAISSPIIIRQIARSRATTALSNGKDIYVGLRVYAFEHGGKCPGKSGDERSSNEILRELFKAGSVQDEKPFYVKGVPNAFEGDGDISDDEALSMGENIWAYAPGANITNDYAHRPLLVAPLKYDDDGKVIADASVFGGQLIVVCTDGSAVVVNIDPKTGEARDDDGNLVFKDGYAYGMDGDKNIKHKVCMPE